MKGARSRLRLERDLSKAWSSDVAGSKGISETP
jgi:hypothetical protein